MGIIQQLFGGGLKDLVLGVFDRIKGMSPDQRAELEKLMQQNAAELQKMELDLQAKAMEYQAKEQEVASKNIVAEAQTGDKYTSRARPTFLYVVNTILGFNYILFPFIHRDPVNLPEPLFWLFGSVMLGYVGARSWEKVSAMGVGKN